MSLSKPSILTALLVATVLTGCLGGDPLSADLTRDGPFETRFHVTAADSDEPLFLAHITLFAADRPILAASTDPSGAVTVAIPPQATRYGVSAAGYATELIDRIAIAEETHIVLKKIGPQADGLADIGLGFRPALDLGSFSYPVAFGTSCQDLTEDRDGDCGLGEPSVEVDALGTIYVSGVCCITGAPPVYVSRDDGHTFQLLETPLDIREKIGIEGDFAIDDNGIIYFADIELAATFQVTAWDKDGNFLHHTKWPGPPLVDRDWIRAEGDGHLYYVYNTGTSTLVYTSTDRGVTWSPIPVHSTGYGLGSAIKGPGFGELWVVGGSDGGHRLADHTTDGGATWGREVTTLPAGGMDPGYFDEAGNLYLTSSANDQIHVAKRSGDGTWHDAWVVSPDRGHHRMPWIAAGGEGKVAVAWYGTLDDEITTTSEWSLFVAISLDANTDTPHWQLAIADPEPVLIGDLQRQLLDFFQLVIGPDDAIHIAYSKLRPEDGTEEQMHYLQSGRNLPLSPETYFWGPKEAAGETRSHALSLLPL